MVKQWIHWNPPRDKIALNPETGIRKISDWGPACGEPIVEDEPEWAREIEKPRDLSVGERIGRTSTPYPHLLVASGRYKSSGEPEWVSWLDYLFSIQPKPISFPSRAIRLSAVCGATYVELRKADDEHYHLFVRTVTAPAKALKRRKDFNTIFLEHAQRTAEAWYGYPEKGWRVEETAEQE